MAIQRSWCRSRLVLITLAVPVFVCVACTSAGGAPGAQSDPGNVQRLFEARCGICHGADGKLCYNNSTDLSLSTMSREEVLARILEGKNTMPPFRDLLSAEQVQWMADYTIQLRTNGN